MRKLNSPANSDAAEPKTSHPLWETLAMAGSFVLLWFWFAARQNAIKANTQLPVQWTVALLVSLAVLVVITVLRMRRFKRALDETAQQMRQPSMPFGFQPTQPTKDAKKKR